MYGVCVCACSVYPYTVHCRVPHTCSHIDLSNLFILSIPEQQTLLNTIANLGSKWPNTLILTVVEALTFKDCVVPDSLLGKEGAAAAVTVGCSSNTSSTTPSFQLQHCEAAGGACVTTLDGYYVCAATCAVVGVFWTLTFRKTITKMQAADRKDWHLASSPTAMEMAT